LGEKVRDRDKARYWLSKKERKRSRQYPLATIVYYGPDDGLATKVVVAIFAKKDDLIAMEKWFSDDEDIRRSSAINQQIVAFLARHHIDRVVMPDHILGCPHEEGVDYPEGRSCPHCPFWEGKDRWIQLPLN
jgi:hypothetical protein